MPEMEHLSDALTCKVILIHFRTEGENGKGDDILYQLQKKYTLSLTK